MDYYLDQLFLEFPHPNTLARLIYDGALKFEDRKWVKTKAGAMTYKMADILSLEIAAFLTENGYHNKSYLFINHNASIETSIVLLGAIKAGITIVDSNVRLPLIKQPFTNNKSPLVFENKVFINGIKTISYQNALKQGENALFFNIPPTDEQTNAFCFFDSDKSGRVQTYPVDQRDAVKQIYRSADGQCLHPYIRVVYHWFNGFSMPG